MTLPLLTEITTDAVATSDAVSVGTVVVRVIVGLTIAAHGWNKFFGGGRIPGTARWFEGMGMKPNGRIHAVLAASTELGGGVLLALGLLTPLAAAAIVGLMIVAGWTTHRDKGFFIVNSGWEYNLVLATIAVGIATIGPGRFSLDHAIGVDPAFEWGVGLAVSLGLGVVAGVGLLAACYRPPAGDGS